MRRYQWGVRTGGRETIFHIVDTQSGRSLCGFSTLTGNPEMGLDPTQLMAVSPGDCDACCQRFNHTVVPTGTGSPESSPS